MDNPDSTLHAGDQKVDAVVGSENRVTLDQLHDKVSSAEYFHPASAPTLTIAVLTLDNGFSIVGKSACADPKKFNKTLGQQLAFDDAIRKLWAFEGYLLRQRLHEEAQ